MPDITMCNGTGCPKKNECFRFRAIPSERQSFFASLPTTAIACGAPCKYFWALEEGYELRPKEEP